MSCKQLFVNLGGGGGGSINTGVLQMAGGVALDSTLRFVEDQNGNDSILKLSTTEVEILPANNVSMKLFQVSGGATGIGGASTNCVAFDGGTIYVLGNTQFITGGTTVLRSNSNGVQIGPDATTQNGALTVKSAGGNIVSFRNSSNVERGYIANNGTQTWVNSDIVTLFPGSGGNVPFIGTENAQSFSIITNNQYQLYVNTSGHLQFKGQTTDYAAIVATNTPATLSAKDATNTNLIPFSAEDFTSDNLSSGSLSAARPMKFGDKAAVTTGNDLGLDAQIAVEHNGTVYYIPCSTVQLT